MRRFVVLAHEAATQPFFDLDNLTGAGRFDLVARSVNAALLTSHGIRDNAEIFLVFRDTGVIRLNGGTVSSLHPDERSIAGLLQTALTHLDAAENEWERVRPGITVSTQSLDTFLAAFDTPIIQLHEDGEPLPETGVPDDAVFVLSDHQDFTAADNDVLQQEKAVRVSLGSTPLHTDHSIAVLHNYVDTDGYACYR